MSDTRAPASHPPPVSVDGNGTPILTVRVVPRSGRTGVAGLRHGALLVRLAAAPVDGTANAALIAFVADRLGLPKHRVRLVAGERSRNKRLAIAGVSTDFVSSRLRADD